MLQEQLTISELAARSGVSASALRFYERRGLIRSTRTSGNQRRYRRAELRRVAFIRSAKTVGLSLEDVAAALQSLPDSRTPTPEDWRRLSTQWTQQLESKIRMLEKLRDELNNCIGCGCMSLARCGLYNHDDAMAADGAGPRYLLEDLADAGRRRPVAA